MYEGDCYYSNSGQYINGYGKYTWYNGDTYIGYWTKNMKQGYGILTAGNIELKCEWLNDYPKDQTIRQIYDKLEHDRIMVYSDIMEVDRYHAT